MVTFKNYLRALFSYLASTVDHASCVWAGLSILQRVGITSSSVSDRLDALFLCNTNRPEFWEIRVLHSATGDWRKVGGASLLR